MSDSIVTVPPGERHFTITRRFEAPRGLVYQCFTKPRHMAHFWGPRGSTLSVCRIDLRVGGVWRTEWTFPNGDGWGYSSVYLAILPAERIDYRDAPDDWVFGLDGLPQAELNSTIAFDGDDRVTTVTVTVTCASVAARDDTVRRGFADMVSVGNDRLAEYLETLDRDAIDRED